MNILDALKETGKATNGGCIYYAKEDGRGVLCWYYANSGQTPQSTRSWTKDTVVAPVEVDTIVKDDWIPYKEKKEKCRACQEAGIGR